MVFRFSISFSVFLVFSRSARRCQTGRARIFELFQCGLQSPGGHGCLTLQLDYPLRRLFLGVGLQVEELAGAVQLEVVIERLFDRAAGADVGSLVGTQWNRHWR